jgi:membrane protein CcdC involved in cytochrome C biogenesis
MKIIYILALILMDGRTVVIDFDSRARCVAESKIIAPHVFLSRCWTITPGVDV